MIRWFLVGVGRQHPFHFADCLELLKVSLLAASNSWLIHHTCISQLKCTCMFQLGDLLVYMIYTNMQVSYIYKYIKFRLLKPSPTSNQLLMGCHCRKRGPQRHNSQQRNGNVQGPLSTPQRNLYLQILLPSTNCILHLLWFQTYVFSTNAIQIRLISTSTQCDASGIVNSNWYLGQLTYPPHDLSDCLMSPTPHWKNSPYPSWARFPSPLDKDLRYQDKWAAQHLSWGKSDVWFVQEAMMNGLEYERYLTMVFGFKNRDTELIWKKHQQQGCSGSFMSVHGCSSVLGVRRRSNGPTTKFQAFVSDTILE